MVDRMELFIVSYESFFLLDIYDSYIILVDYYIGVVAYISLGFDVLIVNYRGSIGFGQGR
jgi:hypothetical protein